MFTETSFGENAGEIRASSSLDDLDFGVGKLYASPAPYESTHVRDDESSAVMLRSDVSAADGLLSPFGSINFAEQPLLGNDMANSPIKSDSIGSISEANLQGQRPDEGQSYSTHYSSGSVMVQGPSRDGNGEAEVVDEIERTQKSNDLIVYTSSRRNSSRNTYANLSHNDDPKKPSRSCRVIAQKDSLSDLKSLQTSRRKRSLLSKRTKSSVWGFVGLPTFEENNVLNPCLGNGKTIGRVRGSQGKSNVFKDQTSQKAACKSSTPTGRISLKIKFGNKSCGVVNVAENCNSSEKSISGSCEKSESKFQEDFPLENVITSDASALGVHLNVTCSVENKSLSTLSGHHDEGENFRALTENRCSDPGTSPDSEVINSVPDAPLGERDIQDLQDSPMMPLERSNGECVANSTAGVSLAGVSSLNFPKLKSRKGKETTGAETKYKVRAPLGLGPMQKAGDMSKCDDIISSCPADCARMTNSEAPCTTSKKVCSGFELNPSPELSDATESSKSQAHKSLISCGNEKKFLKCSRAKGGCKSKSGILDLPQKKSKSSRKKGDKNNIVIKLQIDAKDDASGVLSRVGSHMEAGNQTLPDLGEVGDISTHPSESGFVSSSGWLKGQNALPRNAWVLCDECQKWRRIPATLADQIEQTNCQWTCKDNTDKDFADCSIPQEKSNSEINEELEISDASCDEDAGEPKSNKSKSTAAKQSSWTLIKSNLFLHRSRKTQTIDEVMVCHCKPPSDGRMGCGAKCLNRILNIECVRGTCPCGELCSNQQFQKRTYAKLKWLRCGKKGFGLQSLQDISEGQFLIEYIGEVLDVHTHEARQKEYALQGHKHFYFMTLNGSEVIDACAKGNLGRFINHSCDPNCRTEKWMVNGEVCVGLFAVRDIKKGEEVTFDYNYVRVFGAAAKKCVCGSPNCRGYIGGDPTKSEVIVQEDSDDEYAEPVMICENREMNDDWTDIMSQSLFEKEIKSKAELEEDRYRKKNVNVAAQFESITSGTSTKKLVINSASNGCVNTSAATRVVDMTVRDKDGPDNSIGNEFASDAALTPLDTTEESMNSSGSATLKAESESLLYQTSSPVKLMVASLQPEESVNSTMSKTLHINNGLKMSTTTLPGKLQPEAVESKKKLKFATTRAKEEYSKSGSHAKTFHSSPSIRKGKLKSNVVNDKKTPDGEKLNAVRHKSRKSPGLPLNSHVEAVEGKLNELLDTEGGISKRKDASRGYLKLLFLTAAFGSNGHGEAIQSNRDLSMILDALLKTKSRTVLVDIINKNGLQMLHNIMKRYRIEFIKTPILRKLLKVLEYLAMREILTLEHITGGPPRPGVESFKDSILTLTEHTDKQVHQIARNFRDRWIPWSLRKNCFMEMDDGKMEYRQHSTYGKLSVSSGDHWSDRGGKHADSVECCDKLPVVVSGIETSTLDHSSASGCINETNGTRTRKRKSRWDTPPEECMHPGIRANLSGDGRQNVDNDTPPGFSTPCNDTIVPAAAFSNAPSHQERETVIKHQSSIVLADSQDRFVACMPVSYGIPSSLVQQSGVLEGEAAEVWTVAPGLPFHPFPPLPPCVSNKGKQSSPLAKCVSEPLEKTGQDDAVRYSGKKRTMTCSLDTPEMNISTAHPNFQPEEGSHDMGRKYFRQQKLNHSKFGPPWLR
ncbi:histone-lysine N-methyltransferase ASHH2-like [Salvia miltiorrhiza]|uniref:histone-lysine N-methyltransferase ASHH2-like n=1 Tax=Salvia miltiorrhiza TaxID=226208 RepID=UPI0025ACCC44|nr:histone-lysine N-methyltransferase ASHH2-like [Salvia miltiorrhiza]XP_057773186.1 histone-lysine N-methyltransferase ASHH2-like [Salvia miltiorrhiza]XP_057773187.1 histone-lysine N-methyltransferase ASHH2-like [Salvia miltiorrhiza]